jgi:hypothetical protein
MYGVPVTISDSQLLIPQPEWDAVANEARQAPSFALQLQGEAQHAQHNVLGRQSIRILPLCLGTCGHLFVTARFADAACCIAGCEGAVLCPTWMCKLFEL